MAMAELLGQALLELRTDDSAFMAGVNKAEAAANGLGRTLDATSGSSVALADRMRGSVPAIEGVTGASKMQKQGLFELTRQLGDMSTMYSLGMRPQQIFASQIGQVTGAVQMMAGESSKFAAFLGGPWGVAVMLAVQVLGPLAGGLLSVGEAAEKSKEQVDGLRKSLENLRTKPMEELGKLNLNVQTAQAKVRQAEAIPLPLGTGSEASALQLARAKRDRDAAIANAKMDLQNATSELAVAQAVVKTNESLFTITTKAGKFRASDIKDDSGTSGSSGRTSGRGGRTGGGAAGFDDTAFQRDITSAIQQELQARLALAGNAAERLDIQKQLLENDRQGRIAEIEASKTLTQAQKAIRTAYVNRLYGEPGKVGPNGEIVSEARPGLLNQQAMREFETEQTKLANDMLGRQAETAQAWAQVAPSMRERARLEAEALRLQQQIQTNLLEQQIATGQIADADKARAELRSQQAAGRQGLAERNGGPLSQYLAGLQANRADTGTRIEALMVEELDFVHRSIASSISDRLGVEDPFLRGLIDMFVEDVFIRPFAEALQNQKGSGGGGGLFSSLFSSLLGGGGASPQGSLAGSVAATIGDPQFAGLFAEGGTIPSGSWGIVGEAGAEAIRATGAGIEVMPNSALRSAGGGGGTPIIFDMRGAVMTEDLLRQANAQAAQIMTSGLRSYDGQVGDRVKEHLARRGQ
jgi:hypothetical protein